MKNHCAICEHKKSSHHDGKCDATGPIFRDYCYCDKYHGRIWKFYWTHSLQRIFHLDWYGQGAFQLNCYRLNVMRVSAKSWSIHWLRNKNAKKWYE